MSRNIYRSKVGCPVDFETLTGEIALKVDPEAFFLAKWVLYAIFLSGHPLVRKEYFQVELSFRNRVMKELDFFR